MPLARALWFDLDSNIKAITYKKEKTKEKILLSKLLYEVYISTPFIEQWVIKQVTWVMIIVRNILILILFCRKLLKPIYGISGKKKKYIYIYIYREREREREREVYFVK